jgi:hypothetical protein
VKGNAGNTVLPSDEKAKIPSFSSIKIDHLSRR